MLQSLCLHSGHTETDLSHGGSFVVPELPPHVTHCSIEAVEFPISQYTVEPGWNRIRIDEGLRTEEGTRLLLVKEEALGRRVVRLEFPLTLNRIVEVHEGSHKKRIRTELPHGLKVMSSDLMVELFHPCLVWLGTTQKVPLTRFSVLSETEFEIYDEYVQDAKELEARTDSTHKTFDYLQCAPISGIDHCTRILDASLNNAICFGTGALRYRVSVSNEENMCMRVTSTRGDSGFRVDFDGDNLADQMGLRGVGMNSYSHTKHPTVQAPSKMQQLKSMLGAGGHQPMVLPGEGTSRTPSSLHGSSGSSATPSTVSAVCVLRPWRPSMGNARLRVGWYQPALQSVCTGQSLRMEEELPAAVAPMHFRVESVLEFTDARGRGHQVVVPQGRYTIRSLCDFVSKRMTRSASHAGCEYTLGFEATGPDDEFMGKFNFSCTTMGNDWEHFMLDLSSFAAEMLGFARTTYWGGDRFVAEREVCVPMPDGKPVRGSYVVEEVPHLKKFRLSCLPFRPMSGSVRYLGPTDCTMSATHMVTFETSVGGGLVSHGLFPGTLVRLNAKSQDGVAIGLIGVVHESPPCDHCKMRGYPDDRECQCPFQLRVETCFPDEVIHQYRELDWVITEEMAVHPRLHFPRSGGLPPRFLGFDSHRTPLLTRPVLSPGTFSMEHPSYVLVFLDVDSEDSTVSTGRTCHMGEIGHLGKASLSYPAGKIVTSAVARDGMLRCEAMTPVRVGCNGGRLRVRVTFANPDGSDYELHQCPFSVTLGLRTID